MSKFPKVTVAIPTYNRAQYLVKAIESALNQSYPNIEVVVSNNNSQDNTSELLGKINDPRLIMLNQSENIGMVPNWNICLNNASGEYFILLSDDDFLERDAIKDLMSIFLSNEAVGYQNVTIDKIGVICCRVKVINEKNEILTLGKTSALIEKAEKMIVSFFEGTCDMYPCKILLRTVDMLRIGGYPEARFPLGADAYMWMAVSLDRGYVVTTNKILSNYRVHSTSTTQITGYNVWMKEVNSLCAYIIERFPIYMHKHASRLDRAVSVWNARMIAADIIKSIRQGRMSFKRGLRALNSEKAVFLNNRATFGIMLLSLFKMCIPKVLIDFFRYVIHCKFLGNK